MRVTVTVKLTAVMLTPNMRLKSRQRELLSYTISRVKFESTWFFPFLDLRFQFSLSKWCTRDTRTPSFKLFRSRLRGLILPWFIAAIREVKISRHLRVVLNDSTPFNYTHTNISRTPPPFCCIYRAPTEKQHHKLTDSLPPRPKLWRTDIIFLWDVCQEWSCPTLHVLLMKYRLQFSRFSKHHKVVKTSLHHARNI